MAGGSQIIINKDGIKVITPGKFESHAGQHKFTSGEKVTMPLTSLPTVPNNFSNKVDYKFEYLDGDGKKTEAPNIDEKELFVTNQETAALLAQRKLNNPIEDSTLRFYTDHQKPFNSVLVNSNDISIEAPEDPFFHEDDESNQTTEEE
ncbi:hypothetical protein [Acinetobacter stercoris]|uniref:DUF2345 domain-containing protein n=1 Tax=Acinetobacter stercoris TaxID=2126983 RepID=A0A2U3MW59_9GAMM|nr:hypothetical protein [Acinetobacter stercoris]SPL69615.1 hypothetical protein KPC_0793 [Acinetobacter stercoris]